MTAIPNPSETRGHVGAVFSLPLPPPSNNIYRNVSGRGRVKSDRYKEWLSEAGWEVQRARQPKVAGPYELVILAGRPDKRKRDIANIEKPLSDLLVKHGIVEDDSLAESVTLRWVPNLSGCQIIVMPSRHYTTATAKAVDAVGMGARGR